MTEDEKNKPKPIRMTMLDFDPDSLELQEFINWALSKEKTDSPELNKMRELKKNHVRSKQRNY